MNSSINRSPVNSESIAKIVREAKNWTQVGGLIIVAVMIIASSFLCIKSESAIHILLIILGLIILAFYIVKQDSKGRREDAYRKGSLATYRRFLNENKTLRDQAPSEEERKIYSRLCVRIENSLVSYTEESNSNKEFFSSLKDKLKKKFEQEDILMFCSTVQTF